MITPGAGVSLLDSWVDLGFISREFADTAKKSLAESRRIYTGAALTHDIGLIG